MIECPLCRALYTLPSTGVDSLRINIHLQNIIEKLPQSKKDEIKRNKDFLTGKKEFIDKTVPLNPSKGTVFFF